MYGGYDRNRYAAYVGIAGNLRNRIHQHLVRRDSSVTTGTSAVVLNVDYITEVRWWTDPDFVQRPILEAAELVAFDVLDPILRSRGVISEQARQIYARDGFVDQIRVLIEGDPAGCLVIQGIQDILKRIDELEKRVASIERQIGQVYR
jgi:hypothetical protein